MRKIGIWVAFGVLLGVNGFLLWQTFSLRQALRAVIGEEAYLSSMEGLLTDARGLYTLPTIGKFFMTEEMQSLPAPTLSMAVFLSSKTDCGVNLSEFAVFKRLLPEFQSRGQRIVAVCAPEDSLGVAHLLDSVSFVVPLIAGESEQFSFRQMGISPEFMPFKVLFDSTYTAIYMRGGDNTWESQAEFESAMMRLSEYVANGVFLSETKPKSGT